MRESSPVTFLLGVVLGFIARPIIMGCFSSKPETATHKPPIHQTLQGIQQPKIIQQQEQKPQQQTSHEQPILSVPRPTVAYGDREKNELKVKNLRDKLETTVRTSEQVLQDEARLAVKFHREGLKASARILLRRRQLTHNKIANCQQMLFTVMEMIDSMDMARDNAKFIRSVESGTKAINDIMNGMSVESVQKVLHDARKAEEYTKEIGAAMEADATSMDDAEFERVVAEMTDKYGVPEESANEKTVDAPVEQTSGDIAPESATTVHPTAENPSPAEPVKKDELSVLSIPKPPTERPLPPVTPEPVEKKVKERAAAVM